MKEKHEIKILLVEDESIIAMIMKMQIQNIGYKITHHVVTGEEAIDTSRSNSPDLILMDIRLAGEMDGIETVRIIKSEYDIPVVFITGYEDPVIKEKAKKLNPLEYFIKPLRIEKLKILLDNHFGK